MKDIVSNQQEHLSKDKQQNLQLLHDLYNKMKNEGPEVLDYQYLKAQNLSPKCPNCKSINIKKNGHQQGQQMYKCKECGKNFRETTGTFVYYLHKKELILDYIRCMIEGKSLRACAAEVGISLPTSFNWRHKIISVLKSMEEDMNLSANKETEEGVIKQNKNDDISS
jgi:transposase-like protein